MSAYWAGPWTSEDGGAARASVARGSPTPPVGRPASAIRATSRLAPIANMVVVRASDEVYLQGCTMPAPETSGWVERIDPLTLEAVARTPDLPGGPYWAGGLAAHADGSLHAVHGCHAHRISADCEVLATRRLPRPRPYNSFVLTPDGALVTKDIDLDAKIAANLTVLHPETLESIGPEVEVPEPAIGRLTADGADLYVIGTQTLFRYRWSDSALTRDEHWAVRYRLDADQSFGWDPVVAGGFVWWMDNGDGAPKFAGNGTMRGVGVAPGPVHLYRATVDDPNAVDRVEISGRPHGFICNPPIYDAQRDIAVAFDAGNGVIAAFDGTTLTPRWRLDVDHAGHLLLWPDTGALLVQDHTDVVVLDIESGAELCRTATDSLVQYVLFPAAGARGDAYLCSPTNVTRVHWENA